MATYHFDPATGKVGSCKARSISLCAFGSIDSHFTSLEAASAAYGEFLRLKRDALEPELLGHGDRVFLRNPETDYLLDAVINDNDYNLLIVTAGANAPTNDARSLIEYGWILEKRIGAFGEFAVNPQVMKEKLHKIYGEVGQQLSAASFRAGELRERLKNEPYNRQLEAELKSYEAEVTRLRDEQETFRLRYVDAIQAATDDRKEPGFSGLHDVPLGFTGRNDYSGVPTYLYDEDGSFIQEIGEGYAYFRNHFDDPIDFQNFGEAILWVRAEAAKGQNQS